MAPDLNSLPPSRSSSTSSSLPHRHTSTISPGTTTPSQAGPHSTATPRRTSRGSSIGRLSVSERRRSAAGMHLNLNDPPTAASNVGDGPWSEHRSSMGYAFRTASPISHGGSPIFATADPHHQRAPSLGELHQELEQEQEAQVVSWSAIFNARTFAYTRTLLDPPEEHRLGRSSIFLSACMANQGFFSGAKNRLLQMIRSQQAQLQQYQQQNQHSQSAASGTAVIDDAPTPASERSFSFSPAGHPSAAASTHRFSLSSLSNRRPSRSTSQATSPNILPREPSRAVEGMEAFPILRDNTSRRGSRDESAFHQAEAAMLNRENQMLRQRIRELGESRKRKIGFDLRLGTSQDEDESVRFPQLTPDFFFFAERQISELTVASASAPPAPTRPARPRPRSVKMARQGVRRIRVPVTPRTE
ncbi:hypothetical protein POX_e07271 [Penicillium oxalicum]|uniref:hypothetical protein n=1 Tax=Penicillium oxalicum TaxID=69781 RepID=UPI0020B81264|nr:hypothetical protein POX_e07271 [Penicillium oxalicum]KAI2789241.1 hypothetical protein POX_e07271 [Penicillium oxalicum]